MLGADTPFLNTDFSPLLAIYITCYLGLIMFILLKLKAPKTY